MRSVFSVEYKNPEHTDNYCSVDWSSGKKTWVPMWKSFGGSEWYPEKYFTKMAYEAILEKFHLVKLAKELPMEKVEHMSPATLMKFRDKKGLCAIDAFSDTPGDTEARAEEYK